MLRMNQKVIVVGTGEKGIVVGMQHHTGAGATTKYSRIHGTNRYYVKVKDGIVQVSSMGVRPILTWSDAMKHNLKQAEKRIKALDEAVGYWKKQFDDLVVKNTKRYTNLRLVTQRISDTETIVRIKTD